MTAASPNLRHPTAASIKRAKVELEAKLGPSKVMTDENECEKFSRDDSSALGSTAGIVVFATAAIDIALTLEIAEKYGIPVTPRAGGTGRTGGAVSLFGGIVLATSRLSQVKEVDRANRIAVLEPGVITGDFHRLCEGEGLFYPPDPNSSDSCMLGGNVAENAGGPRALKYGVTSNYVLGLEACVMGGRVLHTGRRTTKGVTGYDVTSLLVGSEGTLAVFSEITVRLLPLPPKVGTVCASFLDVHAAGAAVSLIVAAGLTPRCIELFDRATLDAVRMHSTEIDKDAGALLLIEADGTETKTLLEEIGNRVMTVPGALRVKSATDRDERERLWAARRSLSYATRALAKHKLSEDIVVPRTAIGTLLNEVDKIGSREKVRHLTYGHAGDGNLHVNFLWDDDDELPNVHRAIAALMQTTVSLRGTLSGEHGIGLTKAEYLPLEQSADLIAIQRDLKRVFDPKELLNPGKIFSGKLHRAC